MSSVFVFSLQLEKKQAGGAFCVDCHCRIMNAIKLLPQPRAFCQSARVIWKYVAGPLLCLNRHLLGWPGFAGDVMAHVHLLGVPRRFNNNWSLRWHRRLLGRSGPATAHELAALREVLMERFLTADILSAASQLNEADPFVEEAMGVLSAGTWHYEWYPALFSLNEGEEEEAAALLDFDVFGVRGLIAFREAEMPED